MNPTDPSIYSAVQGGHADGNSYLEKDDRWLYISWPPYNPLTVPGTHDSNRYRLTVDPEDGTILFVDEETDIRQVIDERNLVVLIKRSERIKAAREGKVVAGEGTWWETGCTCPQGWSSTCTSHGAKAPVPGVSH